MSGSGGVNEKKRLRAEGERARQVASVLAEVQGLAVVAEGERADLLLVEADVPEHLEPFAGERARIVALSWRRLRETEVKALREAGASAVIDADATMLDLAFVFSDLLFGAVAALRRYARKVGGVPVRFRALPSEADADSELDEDRDDGQDVAVGALAGGAQASGEGTLLGIARSGAFIATDARMREGTAVELMLLEEGQAIALRGRIAYCEGQQAREGIAIEFALDDGEVAPKLSALEVLFSSEPRTPSGRPTDLHTAHRAPSVGSRL